ncbi:MAG: MCE family protein [Planctomycetes bacterium]|nr:MCE family protein [Planctomycetota bacterium]
MRVHVSRAEIAVGGFLIAAFLGFLVLVVGSGGWGSLGKKVFVAKATFAQVSGVRPGANVRMNGIEIGVVRRVFINDGGRVELEMELDARYRRYLKQSAEARALAASGKELDEKSVATLLRQGNAIVRIEAPLLGGDSVVTLTPAGVAPVGAPALGEFVEGEYLVTEPEKRGIQEAVKKLDAVLEDLLGKDKEGETLGSLVQRIGKTLESLERSVMKLEEVMAGSRESTVGTLMNDDGKLYAKLSETLDEARGTLAELDRSVKGTEANLKGSLSNVDEKVSRVEANLSATTDKLQRTLEGVDRLLAGIEERGLLAAIDGPEGKLRTQIESLLASLETVLADLKMTTEKLPGVAEGGSDLIAGGKGAVGDINDVVAASRRHWLLKGLFRKPEDAWIRAWDLGPGGK